MGRSITIMKLVKDLGSSTVYEYDSNEDISIIATFAKHRHVISQLPGTAVIGVKPMSITHADALLNSEFMEMLQKIRGNVHFRSLYDKGKITPLIVSTSNGELSQSDLSNDPMIMVDCKDKLIFSGLIKDYTFTLYILNAEKSIIEQSEALLLIEEQHHEEIPPITFQNSTTFCTVLVSEHKIVINKRIKTKKEPRERNHRLLLELSYYVI